MSAPPAATLTYGEHPDALAEVWLPAGAAPRALVVVIHGGFWRAAHDRASVRPVCADLAGRGYAAAAPEYRRVGQAGGGWPGTFDDVALLTDRLAPAVAGLLGAPAPRLLLAGHSAGGHLALWAAGRHRLPAGSRWRAGAPVCDGVLALGAVTGLEACARAGLGEGAAQELVGGEPDALPGRYAEADPARLVPLGVPAVLVHGGDDEVVPVATARDLAARPGAGVELRELAGVDHFGVIDPDGAAWPHVLDALEALTRG